MQFPWACEKRKISDEDAYAQAYAVSFAVIEGLVPNKIGDSEYLTTEKRKKYKYRTKYHTFY